MISGSPNPISGSDETKPPNEVTFVQTAEDVLSAADGVGTLPLWRLMLLGGAAGSAFGLLGYVQTHPGFDLIGAVFGLCIFPVAFQWLRRRQLRRAVTRALENKPSSSAERTARWDHKGFESWVGHPGTHIPWSSVTRISRTKQSVLIWRSPGVYEFLPTRVLDANRMATLEPLLHQVMSHGTSLSR